MNGQILKDSLLQLAIKGKLVEQLEEEGSASEIVKVSKTTLAEVPYEIPKNWKWVYLKELGKVIGGGTPKTNNPDYWSDKEIPWLTPADMKFVNEKYVEQGQRFISKKGLENSSTQLLPKDSIVYSSRAPIGYIAITKNEICTNQGFKSLVPNIKEVSDYIFYCLQAKTKDIVKRASGTTFKEISGKEFGNTLIPLPPLLEQKRIVSKIEEILPKISDYNNLYKEITEINEEFPEKLKKSILQYATRGKLTKQNLNNTGHDLYKNLIVKRNELIENGSIKRNKNYENINSNHLPFDIPDSWKWVRLGDIAVLKMGKTPPRSESQYWSLDIPWVSIADMASNNLTKNTKEKISNYALETKFNNILSPKGTLIMSFKLTIGKVSILDMDAVHNEAIVSIFPFINHDNIIKNYLFKTLPLLVEYANTKGAIKGKTLNSTSLNNLMIPLPSLEEQKQIVEEIINFENYVNTLQIL